MSKSTDTLFTSLALGLVFVTLGSCRMLLIKFSANPDGRYEYLPVTVNVCAEVIKLIVSLVLALPSLIVEGRSWRDEVRKLDGISMMKWSIPGFLYFCDNLLAFYVIKSLQPALVVLLGNFVIITTSVLYRIILKRRLHRVQWSSLVILFLAIMLLSSQTNSNLTIDSHRHHAVNHVIPSHNDSLSIMLPRSQCGPEQTQFQLANLSDMGRDLLESFKPRPHSQHAFRQFDFHEGHILILVQCLLSSTANVYNEKIFKEDSGLQDSIYIQNSKLYFFGALFNLLSLVIHRVYREKIRQCGFFYGHNAYSVVLIFITALYGLNVAFILKFRDNMFHMLTSQLITVIVIASSIYFFAFRPSLEFFLAAPIILLAIYIFQISRVKEANSSHNQSRQGHRMQRLRQEMGFAEAEEMVISPDNLQE